MLAWNWRVPFPSHPLAVKLEPFKLRLSLKFDTTPRPPHTAAAPPVMTSTLSMAADGMLLRSMASVTLKVERGGRPPAPGCD